MCSINTGSRAAWWVLMHPRVHLFMHPFPSQTCREAFTCWWASLLTHLTQPTCSLCSTSFLFIHVWVCVTEAEMWVLFNVVCKYVIIYRSTKHKTLLALSYMFSYHSESWELQLKSREETHYWGQFEYSRFKQTSDLTKWCHFPHSLAQRPKMQTSRLSVHHTSLVTTPLLYRQCSIGLTWNRS